MKKIITMLVAAVCTLGAMATEYAGKLGVSVNGEGMSQEATITINQQEDGSYTLLIKNFCLVTPETKLGIGNIELTNVAGSEEYGYTTMFLSKSILITEGDDPSVEMWFGPTLGEVPLEMSASFSEQILSVHIDIDMQSTLGQVIKVDFIGNNPASAPVRGDVTGNGNVDVADVNEVINIMLGK